MVKQQAVCLYGIFKHVHMDIDEVRNFADFEVIEIVDDSCLYPTLLGIDWAFDNLTVIDLKMRRMTFEGDGMRVITPLDPDEGRRYTEPIKEEDYAYDLENIYHVSESQDYCINPIVDRSLSWRSESAFSLDSDEALEN